MTTGAPHRRPRTTPGLWRPIRSSSASPAAIRRTVTGSPGGARGGCRAIVVERWLGAGRPRRLLLSCRSARSHRPDVLRDARAARRRHLTTHRSMLERTARRPPRTCGAVDQSAGSQCGARIGTNGARIDGDPVELARTTPEAPDLHSVARADAFGRGAGRRDGGLVARAGSASRRRRSCSTSPSSRTSPWDHLDYHGTMESYLEAKAVLFTPDHAVRGLLNPPDDSLRAPLLRRTPRFPIVTYVGRARCRPPGVRRCGRCPGHLLPRGEVESGRRSSAASTSGTASRRWARPGR